MEEVDQQSRDGQTYLRWQEIAITQVGNTINLFLTLSGATIALAVKLMLESKTMLPGWTHYVFHSSLFILLASVGFALWASVTRARDFRFTRLAIRSRIKGDGRHNEYHDHAERLGKWTWGLFYWQVCTFFIGVSALSLSLWLGYGYKI